MDFVIFDPDSVRDNLLPLTYTRPVGALRVGITTIAEKWAYYLFGEYSWLTEHYLSEKFPCEADVTADNLLLIAGNVLPDQQLAQAVMALNPGQALYKGDRRIAAVGDGHEHIEYSDDIMAVDNLYDIFLLNGRAICDDFARITTGQQSAPVSDSVTVIGDRNRVFLAEGATVEGCIINVKNGPVYVGPQAEIMEGATLRGPIAIGPHSTVNMGARIYPGTTLGPWCKAGGELNNVVMQGYSNKAHDGFLGNAVIGEWCNLGAGCVASNLKNDYTLIKLWNYPAHRFLRTDLQFCGLIMGDHSKIGVNCMLNTATVMGVGVNLHGAGFPRPFIPSFLEGAPGTGFKDVPLKRFYDIAERVMSRRNAPITDADRVIFERVYEVASKFKQP